MQVSEQMDEWKVMWTAALAGVIKRFNNITSLFPDGCGADVWRCACGGGGGAAVAANHGQLSAV